MIGQANNQAPTLALHKTSNMHDAHSKTNLKGCWKKNGHVISLKWYLETNLHPFL